MIVVLYYAFSAGGFFISKRGYGELVILYLLVMGLIFSLRVEGRLSRLEQAVIWLFGGYLAWMLLSTSWSLSPAESFNEFNRGVLYLAGFLIFFLFMARREWLDWMATLFVVIVAIVAVDGLLLKVVPDIMADYFNIDEMVQQIIALTGVSEESAKLQAVFLKMDNFQTNRLSYPITYWNTMGLFMIMAVPLSLRAAADRARPLLFRCLHAAALVLFIAVVYYTFSRAGYLLLGFTILLYTLLSAYRLRVALQAGLVALWAAILFLVTRYSLPAMVASQPSIDDRVNQGHDLGIVILALLVLAASVQVIVGRFESRVKVTDARAYQIGIAVAVMILLVMLAGFVAVTVPSGGPVAWVQEQFEGISERAEAVESAEERILSLKSERYNEYRVSLGTLADNPVGGTGSGTWEMAWLKERPYDIKVKDGHSWFFDTMAELGIVGITLLAGFVTTFVWVAIRYLRRFGLTLRRGHHDRAGDLYAAVFVTCLAMLLHSTIDWDWEMPVVTLSFFMFAGALMRYGRLTSLTGGVEAGGADGTAVEAGSSVSGPGSSWWVWPLGIGCVVMMALTILPVIAETRSETAQQHLVQAQTLLESNRKDEARAWFEEAHRISGDGKRFNPLDARFLIHAGDASTGLALAATDEAERRSFFEAAEDEYLEALRLQPDNYQVYQRLTEVYLRTAQLDKAADSIWKALELNPLEGVNTRSLEERVRAVGGY